LTREILKVVNLSKTFGEKCVLDKVSFSLFDSETLVILGPSGTGKTTLLFLVAGFEQANTGSIYFKKTEISHLPPYKRNFAMVFQDYALFNHLNVFDNIAFGLRARKFPKREVKRKVIEALEMVGLEGFEKRRIEGLSGGEQQRVALARAMVVAPEVILLDEPLSNLDAVLRVEMRSEIKKILKAKNVSSIFVTHDQEEAFEIADRIAILQDGNILQIGSPEEIYEQPACLFVAEFVGEANFIEARVDAVNGEKIKVETYDELALEVAKNPNYACQVGQKVNLMIRPEKLYLEPFEEIADYRPYLTGTVQDAVYSGDSVKLNIAVAQNGKIVIAKGDPNIRNRFPMGTKVRLVFEESAVRVFPAFPHTGFRHSHVNAQNYFNFRRKNS